MQSPSDFTTGWHFRDTLERDLFGRQAVLYLSALNRRIAGLAESAAGADLAPHALISTYEEVHRAFRMRIWAVESIADLVRRGAVMLPDGLAQVRVALRLALALFTRRSEGALLRLQEARRELAELLPGRDHQLIVAHDVESPDFSIDDDYSWVQRCYDAQRGPMLGVRWELVDPIAPQTTPLSTATEALSRSNPIIRLTRSQTDCADVLRSYLLAQQAGLNPGGYSARPPLIAAQSGAGKTRLVRWFADLMRMPMLSLDAGSWLLLGSRAEKPTLTLIQEFHQKHDRGLVFLDELDKANGNDGGWWQGVNLEIMSYLDARLNWPVELEAKVRAKFLVVGAGTWQSVLGTKNRSVGFNQRGSTRDMSHAIEADFGAHERAIPQELGFRFDRPLLLQPPDADEFAERIMTIRRDAGFSALAPSTLGVLVEDAVTSHRGQRWLEHYANRLVRERCLADENYEMLHF